MPDSTGDYSLVRLRNGVYSVHANAYGETMHPGIGPVAEAEALYVAQTGLVNRLRGHVGEFVIWDVGLGAAANALTVLRSTAFISSSVRLLSFDNTDSPLRFALGEEAQLPHLAGFANPVRELLQHRRVEFLHERQQVRWELHVADFPELLGRPLAETWPKPHLILFDPFSPATNPAMWTLALFERLYWLLDAQRPCVMPTYSRSTMLRVTLLLAGFRVGTGQASGRKEETTIAANASNLVARPLERRWLERARRSDSAEPLHESHYRRAPLSPGTWERLCAVFGE